MDHHHDPDVESGAEKTPQPHVGIKSTPSAATPVSPISTAAILEAITVRGNTHLPGFRQPLLDWYATWLNAQLQRNSAWSGIPLDSFKTAAMVVAQSVKRRGTLGDAVNALLQADIAFEAKGDDEPKAALALVFALIGWLSMLYEPDTTARPSGSIAICDTLDGYRSSVYFKLTQRSLDFRRKLPEVLLGFGLMLPKEDVFTLDDNEDAGAIKKIAVVTPGGLNASALAALAYIKFQWVDVMAPHLELDEATNTVFLYRYPSFCLANLPSRQSDEAVSLLHSLAIESDAFKGASQWASPDEVTGLLKEILLSYRLLFAQDSASRRAFRKMFPFQGTFSGAEDPLLPDLCTKKGVGIPGLSQDREVYRLSRDFPILRERIAVLQQQLLVAKPRGWKAVWADKRETVQWWTFWAVIFVGGTGILLSTIQVILQAIETFR